MNNLRVKCVILAVVVAICLGIEVRTTSTSAATTSSVSVVSASTPTGDQNCQSDYKKIVKNQQGKQVGFIHIWASTCNDSSQSEMQIGSWTN